MTWCYLFAVLACPEKAISRTCKLKRYVCSRLFVQGHQNWSQLEAHMRIPIGLHCISEIQRFVGWKSPFFHVFMPTKCRLKPSQGGSSRTWVWKSMSKKLPCATRLWKPRDRLSSHGTSLILWQTDERTAPPYVALSSIAERDKNNRLKLSCQRGFFRFIQAYI